MGALCRLNGLVDVFALSVKVICEGDILLHEPFKDTPETANRQKLQCTVVSDIVDK